MPEVIKFDSDDGPIYVEVASPPGGGGMKKIKQGDRKPKDTKKKYTEALDTLRRVGNGILEKANEMIDRPDEFSVEVGLTFTAETGVIIAKASTEGNLTVTMTWKRPQKTV